MTRTAKYSIALAALFVFVTAAVSLADPTPVPDSDDPYVIAQQVQAGEPSAHNDVAFYHAEAGGGSIWDGPDACAEGLASDTVQGVLRQFRENEIKAHAGNVKMGTAKCVPLAIAVLLLEMAGAKTLPDIDGPTLGGRSL